MFAAPASSSPFSELFYLKHSVAKGTTGYLVGGIHFILSFLFFQSLFDFVTPSAPELSLVLSPAVSF